MEKVPTVPLTDDQHFLLRLITGAYFAPDLKGETTPKSPLQRRAELLPNYNPSDLVGSHMKTTMMECVYYYLLRKAQPSVVVKQPCLLQYTHGGRPISTDGSVEYPPFDDLFPPELHRRSRDTIDNIVFINNPNTDCMEARDVERFKRLSGLEEFLIDKDSAMILVSENLLDVKVGEACNSAMPATLRDSTCNNNNNNNIDDGDQHNLHSSGVTETDSEVECLDQGMIFMHSSPSGEEWGKMAAAVKFSFSVSGSAAGARLGPILGLMDVGESDDSYLFRVSLPGVKRDERDFSCEVESDGTVIIKGVVVTGERTVEKFSQTFEIQTKNMCPPGPFSVSFKLPGRVDPQRFHGTFATDGILEGVAFKARACSTRS